MSLQVPFNRVSPLGRELEYVQEAISGGQLAGNGAFGRRCETLLRQTLCAQEVFLTPSCTHALEMSSLLLGLGPGDEVIVPSFTFPSTANAFALHGARPVFCDIRPDTLNLDEEKLEALVSPHTRAIVAMHYGGVGCEMDEILRVGRVHGISVLEDNAHGLFGRYRGGALGTFGRLSAQSFHATKNLTCGEGGALFINDSSMIQRAEILREKGTDRSRFSRGEVGKYTWVDLGSSYVMSEILAAFLLAQLEVWTAIQEARKDLWTYYKAELFEWAQIRGVSLPSIPSQCDSTYHLFFLLLPTADARRSLIKHLENRGVTAVSHFEPLHTSAMGLRYGGQRGDCPVSEDVSDRLLRLPLFNSMERRSQALVVSALRAW